MRPADKTDAQEAIETFVADWNKAGENWEVDKFRGLFSQQAQLFAGRPDLFLRDEGVAAYYGWAKTVSVSGHIDLLDIDTVEIRPGVLMTACFMNFTGVQASGQPFKVVNRVSLLQTRESDGWRVQHLHLSPRVEFNRPKPVEDDL